MGCCGRIIGAKLLNVKFTEFQLFQFFCSEHLSLSFLWFRIQFVQFVLWYLQYLAFLSLKCCTKELRVKGYSNTIDFCTAVQYYSYLCLVHEFVFLGYFIGSQCNEKNCSTILNHIVYLNLCSLATYNKSFLSMTICRCRKACIQDSN